MIIIVMLQIGIIFFFIGYFYAQHKEESIYSKHRCTAQEPKCIQKSTNPLTKPPESEWKTYNAKVQDYVDYLNRKYGTNIVTIGGAPESHNITYVADFDLQKYSYNLSEETLERFAKDLAENGKEAKGAYTAKILINGTIEGWVTYFDVDVFEKIIGFITKLPLETEKLNRIKLICNDWEDKGFFREFPNIKIKEVTGGNKNSEGYYGYKVVFVAVA